MGLKAFVFKDPKFDGKTLEKLADHPVFGEMVRGWMREGRTDWVNMKANLRAVQEKVRRQKKWMEWYEKLGDEAAACMKTKVTYATFYKWKTVEQAFKVMYEGLREGHAFKLLKKAREFANDVDNQVDRWNIIKAEMPDYNINKMKQDVKVEFQADIEFIPGAVQPKAVDTTANEAQDIEITDAGRTDKNMKEISDPGPNKAA